MKPLGGIFIGLGSNMGDRAANLHLAAERVHNNVGKIVRKSAIYVSAPMGFQADTDFYNQVLEIESAFTPPEVLIKIKEIESAMGRVKTLNTGYESRIIDLDILDYKGKIASFNNLVIPHQQMHLRSFVLLPLAEIAPDWVHPASGFSVADLISALHSSENAQKLAIIND